MEENVLLSTFFHCLGFLQLASQRYSVICFLVPLAILWRITSLNIGCYCFSRDFSTTRPITSAHKEHSWLKRKRVEYLLYTTDTPRCKRVVFNLYPRTPIMFFQSYSTIRKFLVQSIFAPPPQAATHVGDLNDECVRPKCTGSSLARENARMEADRVSFHAAASVFWCAVALGGLVQGRSPKSVSRRRKMSTVHE